MLEIPFPVPVSSEAVSEKKAFEGLQKKGISFEPFHWEIVFQGQIL